MPFFEKLKEVFTPSQNATQTTTTATVTKTVPVTTGYIPAHPTTATHTVTSVHPPAEASRTTQTFVLGALTLGIIGAAAYKAYTLYMKQQSGENRFGESSVEHLAYPVVVVDDPAELDQIITEAEHRRKLQTKVFILVEGAKEGPNNVSWCPDTVKAEPIIKQVFEENCDKVILIDAPVRRSEYKSPVPHPYRTHPELQVQRIPTLYKWENGHVVGKLVESELFDIERVRRFVRSS